MRGGFNRKRHTRIRAFRTAYGTRRYIQESATQLFQSSRKKADASAKDHAYVPPSQTPVLPADDFILASDIVDGARQAANSKGVPVAKHE